MSIDKTLGMIPVAGQALQAVYGIGDMMFGKSQAQKQQELTNQQIAGSKEMLKAQEEKEMRMWQNTNASAQVGELKKAGLSTGLMYGGGGGGGGTVGGGGGAISGGMAANDAQTGALNLDRMMGLANIELMQAQAKKTNVEAEKLAGADTDKTRQDINESTSRQKGQDFQNAVNNMFGVEQAAKSLTYANRQLQWASAKQLDEYEAWSAANFEGHATNDVDSPLAKAMKAGIEITLQQLEKAKTENNIAKAESTIKNFEANLTKNGISPNSPWYTKFIMSLVEKIGINPLNK